MLPARCVQVPLEANEDATHLLRLPKLDERVRQRLPVLQLQQWRELLAVQLINAQPHVLREHEVDECPLLVGELVSRSRPCCRSSKFPRPGR